MSGRRGRKDDPWLQNEGSERCRIAGGSGNEERETGKNRCRSGATRDPTHRIGCDLLP